MKRVAVAGLVLTALTLSPLAVAQAQILDPQVVQVGTVVECGSVTVTLTNADVGAYGFTWTIGPFDGGPAGESGRIDVAAGATVTETVELPEDSFAGRGFLTLGVAFGPNTHKQPFVDLGLVDTDCLPPVTTTPETTTPPATTTAPATTTPGTTTSSTSTPAPTTTTDDDGDFDQIGQVPVGGVDTGGW